MDALESQLERIGLNPKETQLYLELFRTGQATAQQLAKQIGVPRSTIYGHAKLLLDKNLITQQKKGSVTTFIMNNPTSLERWIEVQKEELNERDDIAKHLIRALIPHFQNHASRTPQVIVANGKREVEQLLNRYSPQWNQSYLNVSQSIMWGYQDHTFVEAYYRWHKKEWKDENAPKQINLFSNIEGVRQQQRDKIPNRSIKLMPSGVEFASSIWIHGEYVLLGNTRAENHNAVLVYEPTLAENLRAVFQLLWRLIS